MFAEEVTDSHGFTLWRYTAPDSYVANATVNPDNKGFCTPNCLDRGLFNMSTCQTSEWAEVRRGINGERNHEIPNPTTLKKNIFLISRNIHKVFYYFL